jgi:hypothetical protein
MQNSVEPVKNSGLGDFSDVTGTVLIESPEFSSTALIGGKLSRKSLSKKAFAWKSRKLSPGTKS